MKDNKLYDFYYSNRHNNWKHRNAQFSSTQHLSASDVPVLNLVYTFFKDKQYTEMIETGRTPVTAHFGDLVLLGTGTYEDVTTKTMFI